MPIASALAAIHQRHRATLADYTGWELPADFGDPAAEYAAAVSACALFDCSHRGKLELTGADAPTLLHNLCTNDIKSLPLGGGCEMFLTTATAKVVGHGYVYHVLIGSDHALHLDTDPGQAPRLLTHLDRYIISEQVELADRTEALAQLHLAGPTAAAVLAAVLQQSVPPLQPLQHMQRTFGASADAAIRARDPLGVPGFDVVCQRGVAETIWQALVQAGARPAGLKVYELLRVEAGTPVYGVDIDENRFVVEVNRPWAICYTKGCYLGQEPIVMARDRAGHAPRQFVGLRFAGGSVPAAGAKLLAAEKEIGQVTSTAVSPRFGPVGLGYVRWAYREPGTALTTDAGQAVTVAALPMGSHGGGVTETLK